SSSCSSLPRPVKSTHTHTHTHTPALSWVCSVLALFFSCPPSSFPPFSSSSSSRSSSLLLCSFLLGHCFLAVDTGTETQRDRGLGSTGKAVFGGRVPELISWKL